MKALVFEQKHNGTLKQLAATPLPGTISLSYLREPDYFQGVKAQGEISEVVGVIENETAVAAVTRSIKQVYINGEPAPIGYLSGLRVIEPYRGRMYLAHGYKYLRDHDADRRDLTYLCTFVRGNPLARQTMTRRHTRLLHYTHLTGFHTYALLIPQRKFDSKQQTNWRLKQGLEIRSGHELDSSDIFHFLKTEGTRKQFYPVYDKRAFDGYLDSFDPRRFYGLVRGKELLALTATWDQSSFKQLQVAGYQGHLKKLHSVLNLGLKLACLPTLPPVGGSIKVCSLAFVASRENNACYLDILLSTLLKGLAGMGYHFLLAGLCTGDRLQQALIHRLHIRYDSELYLAAWHEPPALLNKLDKQLIPYLELATL